MTIRTILVGASGGTASDGAIELDCRAALSLGAHLEGYHVRLDPIDVMSAGGGLALPGGLGTPMDRALPPKGRFLAEIPMRSVPMNRPRALIVCSRPGGL